jgi:hypothetical protein
VIVKDVSLVAAGLSLVAEISSADFGVRIRRDFIVGACDIRRRIPGLTVKIAREEAVSIQNSAPAHRHHEQAAAVSFSPEYGQYHPAGSIQQD